MFRINDAAAIQDLANGRVTAFHPLQPQASTRLPNRAPRTISGAI